MNLQDKTILITGAARGLGREIANLLDQEGCRLVLADMEKIRAESFQHARSALCDLSDLSQRKNLIKANKGKIDILINCAGVGSHSQLIQLTVDEIERVMQINTLAPLELTVGLSPRMLTVNIGSAAGEMSLPSMSLYAASKTALHTFTRSIQIEGAKTLLVILGPLRGTNFTQSITHPRIGQPKWYRNLDLDVKTAAGEIIRAIKLDKSQVILPRWYRIIFNIARWLTPLMKIFK